MPKTLPEVSGITSWEKDLFLVHNDGGNKAELYIIDSLSNLLDTISLDHSNRDWEAIWSNEDSLLLFDIGNNANARTDLHILLYRKHGTGLQFEKKILLRYNWQIQYPAAQYNRYFDVEAVTVQGGIISFYHKNRTKPFSGWLYRSTCPLNTSNGSGDSCIAAKTDSLFLGGRHVWKHAVTDAAQFEDHLYLLTGRFIYRVKLPLAGSAPERFRFKSIAQREAILVDKRGIFVAEERTLGLRGRFQHFKLKKSAAIGDDY